MDRIPHTDSSQFKTFTPTFAHQSKKRKIENQTPTDLTQIQERTRLFSASDFKGRVSDTFPKTMEEAQAFFRFQETLESGLQSQAASLPENNPFSRVEIKVNATSSKIESDRTERGLFAKEDIKKGTFIANYLGELLTLDQFEARYPLKGRGKLETLDRQHVQFTGWTTLHGDLMVEIQDNQETRSRDINGLEASFKVRLPNSEKCVVALSGYREADHTLKLNDNLFIDSQIYQSGQPYILGIAAFANSVDANFVDNQTNNAIFKVDLGNKQVSLVANQDIREGEEILVSYNDLEFLNKQ